MPRILGNCKATAIALPPEDLSISTLLQLVGAKWADHVAKTRLSQVDLEAVHPVHFAIIQQVDVALRKFAYVAAIYTLVS